MRPAHVFATAPAPLAPEPKATVGETIGAWKVVRAGHRDGDGRELVTVECVCGRQRSSVLVAVLRHDARMAANAGRQPPGCRSRACQNARKRFG